MTCALCEGRCIACGGALADLRRGVRMCSTCGLTVNDSDCWCGLEQCEHTEWVPEIEAHMRCTANTLMCTPDTRVLCPAHCPCADEAAVSTPKENQT